MPKSSSASPYAQSSQRGQGLGGALRVAHECGLGDLQDQGRRRQAARGQRLTHVVEQVGRGQLHRRDVDGHRRVRRRGVFASPGGRRPAGLAQHPGADPVDEAEVLGDGDEAVGWHGAEGGRLPAQQRLEAEHPLREREGDEDGGRGRDAPPLRPRRPAEPVQEWTTARWKDRSSVVPELFDVCTYTPFVVPARRLTTISPGFSAPLSADRPMVATKAP